ncbi:hypothetical protein SAMN02745219_01707 [Desulfofundulus thermosubterraneus DSM 16057]|uniref:Uncharacterized protein n=1 Tax=Desulfofundulus thermosubterraneus DSM 16057 TaxID=1121432 RepID=A0A1M6GEM8_9FIRM|nr:hypothetical protein SAMN02745219_01707 [Desulfofundulus thermosubterraneus DSM 16057]
MTEKVTVTCMIPCHLMPAQQRKILSPVTANRSGKPLGQRPVKIVGLGPQVIYRLQISFRITEGKVDTRFFPRQQAFLTRLGRPGQQDTCGKLFRKTCYSGRLRPITGRHHL